jgi:hypothetical protein
MKAPFFCISSVVASGTHWLSSKLSIHPSIVLFHSSGTVPLNILSADDYMDFMVKASHYTSYQKIFKSGSWFLKTLLSKGQRRVKLFCQKLWIGCMPYEGIHESQSTLCEEGY